MFREKVTQSVVYQRILREGLQLGLEQGLRTSIIDALHSQFDVVPENLREQIALIAPKKLQQLNRQAWTCQTLESFVVQLSSN